MNEHAAGRFSGHIFSRVAVERLRAIARGFAPVRAFSLRLECNNNYKPLVDFQPLFLVQFKNLS